MDSPIEVPVEKEWREKAADYAKKAGFPSMRTGKLAEYVVLSYLRKEGLFPREDLTHPTQPDYFDLNLGNATIDVKSCLAPAKELRITKHLFDRGRRFQYYIGVQITKDIKTAKIYGFCPLKAVKSAKTRKVGSRECYVIPFSKLESITKLVNAFRKD